MKLKLVRIDSWNTQPDKDGNKVKAHPVSMLSLTFRPDFASGYDDDQPEVTLRVPLKSMPLPEFGGLYVITIEPV